MSYTKASSLPAMLLMLVVSATTVSAAADQPASACGAVTTSASGSGTSGSRDQANKGDGTFTIDHTYRPEIPVPGRPTTLLDCAWIDDDHDGVYQAGEALFSAQAGAT